MGSRKYYSIIQSNEQIMKFTGMGNVVSNNIYWNWGKEKQLWSLEREILFSNVLKKKRKISFFDFKQIKL